MWHFFGFCPTKKVTGVLRIDILQFYHVAVPKWFKTEQNGFYFPILVFSGLSNRVSFIGYYGGTFWYNLVPRWYPLKLRRLDSPKKTKIGK
jgi:hypothetical protein